MKVLLTIATTLDGYEVLADDGDVIEIRDDGGQDVTIEHNDPALQEASRYAADFSYTGRIDPPNYSGSHATWWAIERIQIL